MRSFEKTPLPQSTSSVVPSSSTRYPLHAPPASCHDGDLPKTVTLKNPSALSLRLYLRADFQRAVGHTDGVSGGELREDRARGRGAARGRRAAGRTRPPQLPLADRAVRDRRVRAGQ